VDALSGSSVDDLAAASDEAAGAGTDAVTGTDDGAAVDATGSFTGD
jgi:hypothetical protein